jgi:hypothetical protein
MYAARFYDWYQPDRYVDPSGTSKLGGLHILGTSMYLNYDGPDSTSHIYIYNDGYTTGEYLRWYQLYDRFEMSDKLFIAGEDWGFQGVGPTAGGRFGVHDGTGTVYAGYQNYGVWAQGDHAGGYFEDKVENGVAYVGYGTRGIWAKGGFAGGTFSHPDNLTFWADVSTSTHKIVGTGAVSFVQNHPVETDKVIIYAAPEGDEVATYTRGTARLLNGEARVPLGDTFRWVTNPDIGLTAHVTPREDCPGLYVASLGVEEMLVRELGGGSGDTVFDYIVYGLRIGFEEVGVLAIKDREALLPAEDVVEQFYAANPELRRHNALERFKRMTASALGVASEDIDQNGAAALREAIRAAGINEVGKVDPATDVPSPPAGDGEILREESLAARETEVAEAVSTAVASPPAEVPSVEPEHLAGFPHPMMPIGDSVEAGDVLVLDTETPGSVRVAFGEVDRLVAGCAVFPGEGEEVTSGQVGVAVSGVIACRADADFGAIRVGDLLTTSPRPGHAMLAGEYAQGALLGKAVEPLDTGTGLIKVLVMLR